MNTRLQVEHPVTEQVAGIDLVRAQISIAAGQPLGQAPSRSCSARSRSGFASTQKIRRATICHRLGPLLLYREPVMPGIRVDSGVTEGSEVTVHYDPLLAKLIASGETREAARLRALAALRSYPILGIRTNIPLLIELLEHPRFIAGDVDTGFLDTEDAIRARLSAPPPAEVAAVARYVRRTDDLRLHRTGCSCERHGPVVISQGDTCLIRSSTTST